MAGAGGACSKGEHCYSGVCIDKICSADSAPNPHLSLGHRPSKGMVPGGGLCMDDKDCYSAYCHNAICAPDGPRVGSIADGGGCRSSDQCYSRYCIDNRCSVSAPGGQCGEDASYADSQCRDGYCVRDQQGTPDDRSPKLNTLSLGQKCSTHAQCYFGWCLYEHCTTSWFIVDRWKATFVITSDASAPVCSVSAVFGIAYGYMIGSWIRDRH